MYIKLLLLSFITMAAFSIERINCLNSSEIIQEAVFESSTGRVDCNYIKEISQTLEGVSQLSERNVPIRLIVSHKSFSASYDLGETISLPQIFLRRSKSGQYHQVSSPFTVGIIAHEYGHAILVDYLVKEMPVFEEFFRSQKEISALKFKTFSIRARLTEKGIPTAQRVELQKELFQLGMSISKLKAEAFKNEGYKLYNKLLAPYHELFADTLAVYYYKDKEFISKIVHHPHYNQTEKELVKARSFNKQLVSLSDDLTNDSHAKFYKVRQFIGENLWSKNISEQRNFLEILLKAMALGVEKELYNPSSATTSDELINLIKLSK